jgi:hypothetical protein
MADHDSDCALAVRRWETTLNIRYGAPANKRVLLRSHPEHLKAVREKPKK